MISTEIRLMAHIFSLALLLASMLAILLAGALGFKMRYRLILVASLGIYWVWFFLLSVSLRDAELIRRGDTALIFGIVELTAAFTGWTWLVLTVRESFNVLHNTGKRFHESPHA